MSSPPAVGGLCPNGNSVYSMSAELERLLYRENSIPPCNISDALQLEGKTDKPTVVSTLPYADLFAGGLA